MRLFSKIFGKPHRRIVVGSRTGKSKKFPLHLPKRTFFTVVVVNSGQNTPPQSLYWWSKPVYPQTRAAEESGSFLEQDSTTVPKSAYPYVWGGSSPSTSFDCSGFVGYVYNQCGWSFGRLGAQGLYNISTRTSSPKPGDLVFFTGTYDTPGISHVGIYVGDGWMLHCGAPISYANLNTSYWQSHFYAYGKLF